MKLHWLTIIDSLGIPSLNLSNLTVETVLVAKLKDFEEFSVDLLGKLVLLVLHQVVDILVPLRKDLGFLYSLQPLLNLLGIGRD
jgi:hypothetical protein